MARLVSPDGTSFELAETETLLGRGEREYNDPPKVNVGPLRGGPTVSRRHARIFRRAGQWYIRVEPEARNPTLVGGRRVPGGEELPLFDDARVQLGDVVLTFRAPAEAAAPSSDSTMAEVPDYAAPAPAAPPPIASFAPEPAPPSTQATVGESPPVAAPPEPAASVAQASPVASEEPRQAPAAPAQRETVARPAPVAQPTRTADWPGRLPGRPAALAAIGVSELKRVNPFRGLMIDEEAWADAHDYHRIQSRLHNLAGHGWGIVEGLEVVADGRVPNTLVIRPGVAVDPQGRALLVAQERRLTISAAPGASLYVALRLREELAAPQRFWSDLDEHTRVIERAEALLQAGPPTPPALELARLVVGEALRNAPDPLNPQPGEIDLRFREKLLVRPRPDLAVAQVLPAEGADGGSSGPAATHRLGLRYLLREIGLTTPYRPRWAGVFRLGEALPAASLLYLTGSGAFAVDDAGLARLREHLQAGGALLVDGCREGRIGEFAGAAERLADALGHGLAPVGRRHPLLTARHVFGEPPVAGPNGGGVAEGGGLVVSTADYGCAWQGLSGDRALPREAIRAALEFGVNVAVFARQRQRPLDVLELEA